MWLKTRISLAVLGIVLFVFAFVLKFFAVPLFVKDRIEEKLHGAAVLRFYRFQLNTVLARHRQEYTKKNLNTINSPHCKFDTVEFASSRSRQNSTPNQLDTTVELVDGKDSYARWKNLPIPIKYKIYFFNVSNPDEVQKGQKPKVQELGPYVYYQERWKTNITKDDDTLYYFQNLNFTFDHHESFPLTDTDEIVVPNLPLMAVITITENTLHPLLPMLNKSIDHIFGRPTDLFLRTTPRDFLFDGLFLACDTNDVLVTIACSIIERVAPPTLRRLEDGRFKFSLLGHKNNTSEEGDFVVNSGTKTIEQLGQISSWRGSPTLSTWAPNSTCNNIVGSDSTIYPPFLTPESVINVFSVDICRSVALTYSNDITYSGIPGMRLIAGKNLLASPKSLPSNDCYCLKKTDGIRGNDGCLLDGALDLSTCQKAPIIMSLPHFYLGDNAYQRGISGLNPTGSLHEMFVDLEPNTGTPLRGHKRAQFNIFYQQVPNITLTESLKTTLMPIVWLDEGVDLPQNLVNELNEQLFDVLDKVNIIFWTLLGIGIVIIVVTVGWSILICHKRRNDVV